METGPASDGPTVGPGFSGAPVWDTDQGGVVGMAVAADLGSGARTAYLVPAALLLGVEPALLDCPFRGLAAFQEQDAAVFFARDEDSARVTAAVRAHPFVPVAGASGVGKSSVVRAGVLPRLRADGHTVTDFVGQPDVNPVRTLAEALGAEFPAVRALARELSEEADPVRRTETAVLLGARVLRDAGPRGHVVLLDQFEQTVGARPADARALLDVLLPMTRAVHPSGARIRILATLRSASLEELVAGGRAEALSVTVQMIAPLTPRQLDEVVRRPVDGVPGVELEPGLAELIVTDAGGDPSALPLVEFALVQLWERRENGRLTHAAYRAIGGVEGALSQYADERLAEVCAAPGGPAETVARRLFERLARPVRDTEYALAPRAFAQLPPELRAAAHSLAGTRLLVIARDSSGRETVALAHEALLRRWPTLRGWLDESRAFLVFLEWHEWLRGRVREWRESECPPDLLLDGKELTMAHAMMAAYSGEFDDDEREFIVRSRNRLRRSARRGRTAVALIASLAVFSVLLALGVWQGVVAEARHDRDEASRTLARLADRDAERDPVLAAQLALAAWGTSRTDEARAALLRHGPPVTSIADAHPGLLGGRALDLAASADGGRIAVLKEGSDGKAAVVLLPPGSARDARPVALEDTPERADAVAVSDDGKRVAAAGADGRIAVWAVGERKPVEQWSWDARASESDYTQRLDFSADADLVLHLVGDGGPADCVGAEKPPLRAHLHRLSADRTPALPATALRRHGCPTDMALPPGDPETLLAVTEDNTRSRPFPTEVHALALGDGRPRWSADGFARVTLGAGGRGLAAHGQDGNWTFRAPDSGEPVRGTGPVDRAEVSDATGRFFSGWLTGLAMSVWCDSRTGRCHNTLLLDQQRDVGPERVLLALESPRDAVHNPVVRMAVGRDMVSLRTAPTSFPLAGAGSDGEVRSLARTRSETLLAAVVGQNVDDIRLGRPVLTVMTRTGVRLSTLVEAGRQEYPEYAVFSNDERHLLFWGWEHWDLYDPRRLTPGRQGGIGQGSTLKEPVVQPLGPADFLLLGSAGLHRLHTDTGDMTEVVRPDCTGRTEQDTTWCQSLVARPGHPYEVMVVRDRQVELWNVRTGRLLRQHPVTPSELGGHHLFRADGQVAAISTDDGITLWNPDEDTVRELPMESAGEPYAFTPDGQLVGGSVEDDRVELWNTVAGERLAVLGFPVDDLAWSLTSGSVSALYATGWARLPLDPEELAAMVCTFTGTAYPTAVRHRFPPHTDTAPAC